MRVWILKNLHKKGVLFEMLGIEVLGAGGGGEYSLASDVLI